MGSLDVGALIEQVSADIIEPRFRALTDDQVSEKKPGDLVTVADREAEIAITAALREHYPDAVVVGEEATAADPDLPAQLAHAEHAWLVDPVDGTRNFVHGSPDYAVMVAEVAHGETVRGWIWQPESRHAWFVERGSGVFCDGAPMHRQQRNTDPIVATSWQDWDTSMRTELPGAARSRLCCGVDYPLLASGEIDALAYRSAKPWDHAVGALMVTEIGGVARFADGRDYRPDCTGRLLIAAATEQLWQQIHRLTTSRSHHKRSPAATGREPS